MCFKILLFTKKKGGGVEMNRNSTELLKLADRYMWGHCTVSLFLCMFENFCNKRFLKPTS